MPSVREMAHLASQVPHKKISSEFFTVDFVEFASSQRPTVFKLLSVTAESIQRLSPCTPVQTGMLASFLNSNGNSYFNHLFLKFDISVNISSLRQAWACLVDRHEMLRTGFFQTDRPSVPFGMITYAAGKFDLPWSIVECLDSEELSSLRKRLSSQALNDLAVPPWFLTVQNSNAGILMQFSAHHALYDAQSMEIILSDLCSILQRDDLSLPIPIRPIQEIIVNESMSYSSSARAYWQGIQTHLRATKFPDMHPNHNKSRTTAVTAGVTSQHSLSRLQDLCSKANVSLQAACQAAWAKLMAAYVGEDKVTCGIVMSGRNVYTEARDAAFPCLVTLPTYYDVGGTNRELLSHIMAQHARMTRYQFTPLAKIHEWTNSESSLFNTLFIFQKPATVSAKQLPWTIVEEKAEVDYAISLEIVPFASSLRFNLSFRYDLLPEQQGELILRQLDCLLLDCISSLDDDATNMAKLPLELLSVISSRDPEIPTSCRVLHGLFEDSVRVYPSRPALEFISRTPTTDMQARRWTYTEMEKAANQFAHLLLRLGALPGDFVAICFNKCPEAYMAILGILKAGCAYVAIDPTSPRARQDYILQDSGARILLASSDALMGPCNSSGVNVVVVDEPDLLRGLPGESPLLSRAVSPEDVCYCLYTSGTTGTPKGCQITHNNAVQAILSFQRLFGGHWDESSRWLQFASFHFDVSVLEQYWSWSVGVCLVSCPRDLLFEDLPGTLARLAITHIDLTPSLARLIHPEEVPSLQKGVFITGGEALRQDILDEWGQYKVIYNGYGPTEVTIGCTMYPRVPANGKPSNIGPQFDNVSSYVLRPGTNVPILRGAIGELCVGGPLVGKGYLNRDDLTKERFIFLDQYNDRVYRTGDLVRLYYDGTFCFLGRQDDQVKLRGQRLEINEINETIRRSTQEIEGVATIVSNQAKQIKSQLVSFLVATEQANSRNAVEVIFTLKALQTVCAARRACMSSLPGYMVPTHFISLNKLPLSANNKLDVRRLESIYDSLTPEDLFKLSRSTSNSYETVTEDMKKFVSLVADFLGIEAEKVPPESSLFQLGLDSITVTLFARNLINHGFPNASPAKVMKNSTIASLYKALAETPQPLAETENLVREVRMRLHAFSQMNHLAIAHGLHVNSSEVEQAGPCTPLQEGMIYQYLRSQGKSYLANFVYELSAEVSLHRLKQALTEAVRAMPILRTKFVSTDNGFAQAVLRSGHTPVTEVKVRHDMQCGDLIREHFASWCVKQHHLSSPWEIIFFVGPAKRFMVLHIFHGIYDGISLPFVLDEISRLYTDKNSVSLKPSLLDALPWILSLDISGAMNFWQMHLKKQGTHSIAPPNINNIRHSFVVIQHVSGIVSLEDLRRELNVTEQAIFLACWLCTAVQHFGFSPSLGVVVSGRAIDFDNAQDIIGPTFNTIPCAVDAARSVSMRDLAKACHDYYISTIPYQHTSLRDIRKWLKKPTGSPLFDILFVFQKGNIGGNPSGKLWQFVSSDSHQDFNLSFEVQRSEDNSLTLTLATNDAIMSSDTSEGLCASFADLLRAFLQNLDLPLNITALGEEQVGEIATPMDSPEPTTSFEWTPLALKLREQIALLAEVDCSTIQENTSIFELGLDSIDVIRLSSRMRSSGVTLPVSAVMKGKTIANLMASVSSCNIEEHSSQFSIDALKERLWRSLNGELSSRLQHIESIMPATPLQEAMVAEMVSSNFSRYYNHNVMSIPPWVGLDRLKNAWADAIRRNPIFRTRFAEVTDPELPFSYAQVVCSAEREELASWVVKEVDEDVFDDEINRALRDIGPVDALSSPLVKLRLITASAEKRCLLLSVSHALYDGWSLSLLHQDVHTAYYNPTSPALSRPSYETLLGRIVSSSSVGAAEYWEGALRGYTPIAFPKQPRAESGESVVHRQSRTISTTASQLYRFCKSQNISPQTVGIACWSLVLAGYLHKLDIVFGTVMSGRDTEDAEAMMFPLFNTVAIRSILHGSRSDFLKYMQEVLISMREFQHFPLRKAKAFANCASANMPLFDTLFIYQRGPKCEQQEKDGDNWELYKSVGGESDVEIPLCAEMEIVGDEVVWRVSCQDTLCGNDDVTSLFNRVEVVLGEIMERSREGVICEVDGRISICGCPSFDESDGEVNDVVPVPFNSGHVLDKVANQQEWKPTQRETGIRNVLASVAGISPDNISRDHNLLHLGLDSISAIKVCSLLRKQSIFIAVSEILKAGTVPEMAKVARTIDGPCKEDNDVQQEIEVDISAEHMKLLERYGLREGDVEYVLPATAGQMYMLATHESSNGELFYPYFVYKMATDTSAGSEDVDRDRLNAAWRILTSRLPILRTVFIPNDRDSDDKLYLQVVIREVDNPVQWQRRDDLKKPASPLSQHAKHRYIAGELPVTLYATIQGNNRDDRDDWHGSMTLILHIHHALYDAVSLQLMMSVLAKLYFSTDPNKVRISPGVDLRDLSRYLCKRSVKGKRESFWRGYLRKESEAVNEHLKQSETVGFDRLQQQPSCHGVEKFRQSLLEDLGPTMQRARDYGVSIQAVFLACFARVWQGILFKADGKRRRVMVIGVYLSNRGYDLKGLPRMLAPTLNIVPLRIDLGEGCGKCVMGVAKEIQKDLQVISHEENSCVSLAEIMSWTGVRVDVFINFLKDIKDV
ncbi:Nonribosomal Peptide Synthase (NRPS), partial [Ascosphaera aggregata]